jgi:hypothetical protein
MPQAVHVAWTDEPHLPEVQQRKFRHVYTGRDWATGPEDTVTLDK